MAKAKSFRKLFNKAVIIPTFLDQIDSFYDFRISVICNTIMNKFFKCGMSKA